MHGHLDIFPGTMRDIVSVERWPGVSSWAAGIESRVGDNALMAQEDLGEQVSKQI